MISYILALAVGALVLGMDQYTKYLIVSTFDINEGTEFINGILDIQYIRNGGGAWGILEGHTWGLLAMTIAIMIICISLLFRWGMKNKLVFWAMSLVLFGGIGNMIDRIFRGGLVVDFLHFEFWDTFPVFNVADCFITCGCVLLMIHLVFFNKEIWKDKK